MPAHSIEINIKELLSLDVMKEQRAEELKLAGFEELSEKRISYLKLENSISPRIGEKPDLFTTKVKRNSLVFPAVFELSSLDGGNGFKLINEETSGRSTDTIVSSAGDINADGIGDLIIGFPSYVQPMPPFGSPIGRSYVVFGKKSTWSNPFELSSLDGITGFRLNGEEDNDQSGYAVSAAGDVNGDGIDDLIIGAQFFSPSGRSKAGRSYVVFGHVGNWNSVVELSALNGTTGFKLDGETENDYSGYSVNTAGDINNDGIGDFVIGAWGGGSSIAGRNYVIFGHNGTWINPFELSSLDGTNGFKADGAAGDRCGESVSAGDFNGDNISDIITGCTHILNKFGGGYVLFGHTGSWSDQISLSSLNGVNGFRLDGEVQYDYTGAAVSNAGDVNGDGIEDLLIGSYQLSKRQYIIFGHKGAWSSQIALGSLDGTNGFKVYGVKSLTPNCLSGGGDVNGDRIDDIIIGDPTNSDSYVIFGHEGAWSNQIALTSLNGINGIKLNGIGGDYSGKSVSIVGDVNADGIEDLAIGGRIDYELGYVVFGRSPVPKIYKNTLSINDGGNVLLSSSNLAAIDYDNPEQVLDFTFIVNNTENGYFMNKNSSDIVVNFLQSEVVDGEIEFVHEGNNIKPFYEIAVSNGTYISSFIPANVFFNYRPTVDNNRLMISKGANMQITAYELIATDTEGNNSALVFHINQLVHGQFWDLDMSSETTSFAQQKIMNFKIRFIHDGTDYAPYFTANVTDGILESGSVPVAVTCLGFPCLIEITQSSQTTSYSVSFSSTSTNKSSSIDSSDTPSQQTSASDEPLSVSSQEPKGSSAIGIAFGIIGGILVCGIIGGGAAIYYRFYCGNKSAELNEIALEDALPFRIIHEIGHGGYATVYEGKYTKPGSKKEIAVAIKQLHRVYVESSGLESVKDEFEKEAAFLQQYKHPNLIEIIDFIPDPHWCIVLKYYHRGSLANVLRDQKYLLPWNPERNGFMQGIAEGLKFLHANNIIHRDMKPDNVLIDEDMRPKITDFGSAKIQDTLTQTKGVGTPIYIAPEVVRPITGDGKVHYDSAVDVYALGLILWAIWKREEPFQEFENAWQMMTCVIDEQGRPSLEECPSYSLANLMSRCWAHRPDVRPKMPQVCDELNTVTAELAFA